MNDLNEWLDCWRPIRAGFEKWSLHHGAVAICYLPSDGSLDSSKRLFDLRPENPARLGLISAEQLGSITWCLLHEGVASAANGTAIGDTDLETEVNIANRICDAFKLHGEHAGNVILEAPAQLAFKIPDEWQGYRGLKLWIAALFGEANQPPDFRIKTVPGVPRWCNALTYPSDLKTLDLNPFASSVVFIDRLRSIAEQVQAAASAEPVDARERSTQIALRFPPLPSEPAQLRAVYDANNEMLDLWRERKNVYMPGYVMLGRWGQTPDVLALQDWMERLTYSPTGDAPDERLADPRELFPVSEAVKPYLPPTELWRRFEKLAHIRHDAMRLNFNPKTLALDAQDAVLGLIAIAESLCDRVLEVMETMPLTAEGQPRTSADNGQVTVLSNEISVPEHQQAFREKLFPNGVPKDPDLVDCIIRLDSKSSDDKTPDMELLLEFFNNDERAAKRMQGKIRKARFNGVTTLRAETSLRAKRSKRSERSQ